MTAGNVSPGKPGPARRFRVDLGPSLCLHGLGLGISWMVVRLFS